MDSVLYIWRLFRRLITRIRGLFHTNPAVCHHCNISGGVNAKLREASRRGHIDCVNACIASGANVNTEGTTWGVLFFRYFRRGVLMFKCFIFLDIYCIYVQMLSESTGQRIKFCRAPLIRIIRKTIFWAGWPKSLKIFCTREVSNSSLSSSWRREVCEHDFPLCCSHAGGKY